MGTEGLKIEQVKKCDKNSGQKESSLAKIKGRDLLSLEEGQS